MEKGEIPKRVREVLSGKRRPIRNGMLWSSGEGVRHAFSSLPIPGFPKTATETTVQLNKVPEATESQPDTSRSA